jgi:hypothetical protein
LFRHNCYFPCITCIFLQLSSLPLSELSHLVCYPRTKELTDDEDKTSSSPRRQKMVKEGNVADEPMATVPRGVRGAGGRMRGLGKRVISRHLSPALRGHLDTMPKHSATIKLPEQK